MLIWQDAVGATEAPQLLFSVKSPDTEIRPTVSGAPPELVRVATCDVLVVPTAWDPNESCGGSKSAPGTTVVPIKVIVCGLPGAVSVIVIVPMRVPAVVGVNVALNKQSPPAASVPTQLPANEKSPLAAILEIVIFVALFVFARRTDAPPLVVPSGCGTGRKSTVVGRASTAPEAAQS